MKNTIQSTPFIWAWIFSEIKTLFSSTKCHLFYKSEKISLLPDFATFTLSKEGIFFSLFSKPLSIQTILLLENGIQIDQWQFIFENKVHFFAISSLINIKLYTIPDIEIYYAYNQLENYIKTANFKLNGVYKSTGDANLAIYELDIDDIKILSKNFSKNYRIQGIALVQMYRPKRKIEVNFIEDIQAANPDEARIQAENFLSELGDFIRWISFKSKSTKLKS